MRQHIDARARQLLFAAHWKNGWVDGGMACLSAAEFAHGKAHGLMFDPVTLTHDECLAGIQAALAQLTQPLLARAFVSSLGTRRLDWRSAIASWALAQQIPPHPYTPVVSGESYDENGVVTRTSHTCLVCRDSRYGVIGNAHYVDENLNVLNFERLKWGGVRHGELLYTWFDLTQFLQWEVPEPTPADRQHLRDVLHTIATAEAKESPNQLAKRLAGALPSNQNERCTLLEILASLDVLQASRARGGGSFSDWTFAEHWRGEDGINQPQLQRWFGAYL